MKGLYSRHRRGIQIVSRIGTLLRDAWAIFGIALLCSSLP